MSSLPSFRASVLDDEQTQVAVSMMPVIETLLDGLSAAEYKIVFEALNEDDQVAILEVLTAKYMAFISANDPLTQAMNSGLRWGDVMYGVRMPTRVVEEPAYDPDAGWRMPTLRLRKDIWENFPVTVCALQTRDESERYAIRWHHKNFAAQRENVESFADWEDFEEDTYRHLLKALNASRYWMVCEAEGADDLCVITMNHSDKVVRSPLMLPDTTDLNDSASVASSVSSASSGWEQVPVTRKAPAATFIPAPPAHFLAPAAQPQLRRLNDIKERFPVVWAEVSTGNPSRKVYGIELFGKKVRELGLNTATVKAELLAALKTSPSWTVLSTVAGNQVAQIEMNIKAAF